MLFGNDGKQTSFSFSSCLECRLIQNMSYIGPPVLWMALTFGVSLNSIFEIFPGHLQRGCEFYGFMFFLILVMIKRSKYTGWNKYGSEFTKFLKTLHWKFHLFALPFREKSTELRKCLVLSAFIFSWTLKKKRKIWIFAQTFTKTYRS